MEKVSYRSAFYFTLTLLMIEWDDKIITGYFVNTIRCDSCCGGELSHRIHTVNSVIIIYDSDYSDYSLSLSLSTDSAQL